MQSTPKPRPTWSQTLTAAAVTALAALLCPPAWAGATGGSMPWSAPLTTLSEDLTGPTLALLLGISLAVGAIAWAFSDSQRGLLRVAKSVAGILLAFGGGAALLSALGISGSVV